MILYIYIGTVLFWIVCFITMVIDLKADIKKISEENPERVKIWQKPRRKFSSIAYIVLALMPVFNVISALIMTFGYRMIINKIIESYEEKYTIMALEEYFTKWRNSND